MERQENMIGKACIGLNQERYYKKHNKKDLGKAFKQQTYILHIKLKTITKESTFKGPTFNICQGRGWLRAHK